jgi:hypothetical protein
MTERELVCLRNAREGVRLHPGDADMPAYLELERRGLVASLRPQQCSFVPGPKSGPKCRGCAKCDGWHQIELTVTGRALIGN